MMSWVPSVEPVSTITQVSISGFTDAKQRQMTSFSFLTIMFKQTVALAHAPLTSAKQQTNITTKRFIRTSQKVRKTPWLQTGRHVKPSLYFIGSLYDASLVARTMRSSC
jgi:hypothetical protein